MWVYYTMKTVDRNLVLHADDLRQLKLAAYDASQQHHLKPLQISL